MKTLFPRYDLVLLFYLKLVSACFDGDCRELVFPWPLLHANKRLVNHNIRTEYGLDMELCQLRCYHEPNCVSINYEERTQTCELNNATLSLITLQGHLDAFEDKVDYVYQGAESACDEVRCDNGGICQSGFTDKRYRCLCIYGFTGEHCETDINECEAPETHNCSVDAICNNTKGSFDCTCKPGNIGDGYRCTDINECETDETNNCSAHAICNNTKGSFNCTCKPGYTGDGYRCSDIDECNQGGHDCLLNNSFCVNTNGSYNCACSNGYVGNGRTSCDPKECLIYTNLSSSDRKLTHAYDGLNPKCDHGIGPGWFRFEGAAGTRMPTTCPPENSCGAPIPGWMKPAHPSVADGKVSRQACFHFFGNCCIKSSDIQVRNCGSFFVYHFHGTPTGACNARYCGTD